MDHRRSRLRAALSALVFPVLACCLTTTAFAQARLEAQSGALPLHEETLDVVIDRQYAETRLLQTFHNAADESTEGRYRYQAPDGSRVHGFSYWNGAQRIVGEVFEKETAEEVYREVTSLGNDPGILHESGNGGFTFRVFPIAAKEDKRIELRFGASLHREGKFIEYRAPLSGAINFRSSFRISDEAPIDAIESPSHHISIKKDLGNAYVVSVGDRKTASEDLVIRYSLKRKPATILSRVHRDVGYNGYVALSLSAPKKNNNAKHIAKDITLVIDRSGSMMGEPMEQAKAAALQMLDKTKASDRINVIAFDDQVESVFDRPIALNGSNITQISDYINALDSRGGTDIALALKYAFARQHDDSRPHFVLFLTDGQSDGAAALLAAKGDNKNTRVYSVGVGNGVNKYLLEQLAEQKRGSFTFVQSAQSIPMRMRTLYKKLSNPVLIDLEMSSNGVSLYDCYPQTLPDLFAGEDLDIRCRVRGKGESNILIRGFDGDKEISITKRIMMPSSAQRPWVGRTWATSRINELMQKIELEGENEELKNGVINIALAYNLTTPYTSFLAIPEAEITDNVRGAIDDARARKRALLDSMPDAAKLSRNAMPPGDPLLKVRAPSNALSVTARFPFGLVKDLYFNPRSEHWECRFLVPNFVQDGGYKVEVFITPAFGAPYMTTIEYEIDSDVEEFDIAYEIEDGTIVFEASGKEELRQVIVALKSDPSVRVELEKDENGRFVGELEAGKGVLDFIVVATDIARNETIKEIEVVMP